MKNIILFLLLVPSALIVSQDVYHEELISSFMEENGLNAPSYVFDNNEDANVESMYTYGAVSRSVSDVDGFDFSKQLSYTVSTAGNNQWDSGTGLNNKSLVSDGDVLVFTFWAKRTSGSSDLYFFVEDATDFEKEFYQNIELTPDWNQYHVAVKAGRNYPINRLVCGFHLAAIVQDFELAGLTAFNFGDIELELVPSTFGIGAYEGSEDDAPWRLGAAERIEEIRKADLVVKVIDSDGNPVSDADITVEMQEHLFKFGSAFVTCRFEGNRCYDKTYVDKIFDLDGKGHGFNAGVTENALKWDGWEEQWIGTPDETVSAVKYLSDNGVQMRGHTLIWPGYTNMPDDIAQNNDNLEYLRQRLSMRIDDMINHPVLSQVIREWDVLNEITQNRSLEEAFSADPNFTSGREIYQEIMAEVLTQDPELKLYINDYVVLSGGGSSNSVVNRYKEYLDEIYNSETPFDGIGFQAHIGGNPTSIVKAESVFDDFYARYGKRLSVTEYDISDLVDEETQADYMADFLTLTFSHPAMDAFIMWGFWDGNHWKGNAPLFDINWNLKPSGQAFIDKVFDEWWTNESASTNAEGIATIRAFKGSHIVAITYGDESMEMEVELDDDGELTFQLAGSSSVQEWEDVEIEIHPSLVTNGSFVLTSDSYINSVNIDLYNTSGMLLRSLPSVTIGNEINVDFLESGIYIIKLNSEEGSSAHKIQIVK